MIPIHRVFAIDRTFEVLLGEQMDFILGTLLFFTAVTMVVLSVQVTRAAAPDRRIPPFRATLRRPLKATILQGLAVALSVLSGLLVIDVLGVFAALVPLLVGAAWLVAVELHNRQVEHGYRHAATPG